MNPQHTTFIIVGAILLPVVIAAAVGLPTWFAARTRGEYLALAADYRVRWACRLKQEFRSRQALGSSRHG